MDLCRPVRYLGSIPDEGQGEANLVVTRVMLVSTFATRFKVTTLLCCACLSAACSGALPECGDSDFKAGRWQALEDRVLQATGAREFLLVPTVEFTSDEGRKDLTRFCSTSTTFELRPDLGNSASQATVETKWEIRANDATAETDFAFAYLVDVTPLISLQREGEALLAQKAQRR